MPTTQVAVRTPHDAPGQITRWIGFLLAPIAWSLRLVIAYGLVPVSCAAGHNLLIHVATATTLILAIAGGVLAYRTWKLRDASDGTRFMGAAGLMMTGIFVIAMLAEWYPSLFLGPCART